jgi:hypothetical protein
MKKSTIDRTKEPLEKAAGACAVDAEAPLDEKVGPPEVSVKEKVIQIADALKKRLAK